ncbi:MarR family winged helix-turn-helix transcriptional regulator [Nocardia miyunensis]|uniref:MarR family winged helix-turn-helix transcriptional regulator n=1 Tax=Nocardia miyunensis TaxID=282684 RepID=UPI000831CA05|nr:MarR family transcriptional regulator [Nocardia miyunensis]
MTTRPGKAQLDYVSSVEFAVEKADRELGPIDPTAMRLVLTLHRVTTALVYDLESSVHRPRGWSWSGFRVLFVLWLGGPLEAKRVAELSGMSRAAVSALVNTLERDGLIEKTRADHDRRAVQLTLTAIGHDAFTGAFPAHNEREQAWAGTLSGPEQETLIGLLDKLMNGADDIASKKRF